MKVLDKYVASTFVAALALVIVTFMSLFIAVDLSSKFAKILALKNIETGAFFLRYYMVRVPIFLHLVLPAVTLFASMFTLIRFQKTNEILPMVTSGISLRRVSRVFLVGAIFCALIMAALDEFVLPELMNAVGETDDVLVSDRPTRGLMISDDQTVIQIDEYNRVQTLMTGVTIWKTRPTAQMEFSIKARYASWNATAKRWEVHDGTIEPYDEEGNPEVVIETGHPPRRRVDPIPAGGILLATSIVPDKMRRKFSLTGRFYKMSELLSLVARFPHVPSFRMQLYSKISTPVGSLVLFFLGLPFVATAQGKSFFRGLALCLILTISYYATHFLFFQAGNRGEIFSPLVASSAPTIVFGLIGMLGFVRMKS